MSVLSTIISTLPYLLEGKKGDIKIPSNRFEVVDTSRDLSPGLAARAPYPVHIWLDHSQIEEEENCDLSGNYVYHEAAISLVIYYADKPNNRVSLYGTISDDNLVLSQCLSWPLNWALVPGWVGASLENEIMPIGGDDAPLFLANYITLLVTVRENKE